MRRRQALGPLLTLGGIVLTEIAQHGLRLPWPLPPALLLASLAGVVVGAFLGGFRVGAVAALLLGVYAPHFTVAHEAGIPLTMAALASALTMLSIGLLLAAAVEVMRRREERLRREIEERARALEARNEELTVANAALEAFGYVVSHDLKEPVRAIENYLAAAREEWGRPPARDYVDEAYEANRRLTTLLQGLLAYSRTATLPMAPRPVRLEAVLASDTARSIYAGALRERKARLDVEPVPLVLGDEVLLSQILGNLVLNAVKHNPKDGAVVRVRALPADAGRVHLVVEDDGPGFPADVVRRLDELTGLRPATVRGGFGLVISHRAAKRLDARLWLENRPEGGGAAHLDLPSPSSTGPPQP